MFQISIFMSYLNTHETLLLNICFDKQKMSNLTKSAVIWFKK